MQSNIVFVTGNEAIARGAYEAGVTVGTAYPGTPSTEILESLAQYPEIRCNWSTNEKTALETAIGASMEGARVLVAMKHVGVNVASDPLMTFSYIGVGGGVVLVSADDPGIHSSQNEQDNRHYARFAKIPMLEPADSQEAKDYTSTALEISEHFDTPVMLRTTTRISHSRGTLLLKKRIEKNITGFKKNYLKYVMLPEPARYRHPLVEKRLIALREEAEVSKLNQLKLGSSDIGIICSGVVYQYVREALPDATILKLGFSYPLPIKLVYRLAEAVKEIIIIEELDPFIEEQILALQLDIPVKGKGLFKPYGEISIQIIREEILGQKPKLIEVGIEIPNRPPVLCPGCSHRGLFYILKKMNLNVMGDIGCYTLGALPPLEAIDSTVCMGASIGMALGMELANSKTAKNTVAVIGDSTFIHSGITSLIDVIYNDSPTTILILDNSTTAMTGQQNHPGTGKNLQGESVNAVNLENLCCSLGIKRVRVVDAFDLTKMQETIKEELNYDEPSVIIIRQPCIFLVDNSKLPYQVLNDKCNCCKACIGLGCPALSIKNNKAIINSNICNACGLCEQICRFYAINTVSGKAGTRSVKV